MINVSHSHDHASANDTVLQSPYSAPSSATRSCRAWEVQLAVHAWLPGNQYKNVSIQKRAVSVAPLAVIIIIIRIIIFIIVTSQDPFQSSWSRRITRPH